MKSFFRELLLTLVMAFVLFFLLQATVQNFYVDGASMEPSFQDRQRLLVSKVAYYLHEPDRGDVLIFRPPQNEQKEYIKRLIGLPGDEIDFRGGTFFDNGVAIEPKPIDEIFESPSGDRLDVFLGILIKR